ncbi:MAG TPA: type I glutamate--ammonia ligase [Phycisphaerae bacterium]|nr:type I glutamate--ammonia ligase [Phycisphaerae bacterium]
MFSTPGEALEYISDHNIDTVDLKVSALAGQWMHLSLPARACTPAVFDQGVGYDGSSGSGLTRVENGDVAAVPDPATAFIDPFSERPTLSFICDTVTADTRQPFPDAPRTIAKRAEAHLADSGIADQALFAPEFEFHVFDRVEVINEPFCTTVEIDAAESQGDGSHYPLQRQRGYMSVPPADQLHDLRNEIAHLLEGIGVPVRYHHHEVGASGQCEIEVELDTLTRAADRTQIIKYVVKNVAARRGKIATFMPKPIHGENGNGMHVHQKLANRDHHLFFDGAKGRYGQLSDTALWYIAGLLQHAPALTALTNPSTNSFKRLVPGYEAPVSLFFSLANRSAAIRVPRYATSPAEKRIEYRPPDFTGNIYLSLAAMLLAGLDGIRAKLNPAEHNFGPFDVDIAAQDDAFRNRIATLPRDLSAALDALTDDHDFLCRGEVFRESFFDHWRQLKLNADARQIATRPHPYEYQLYLDT